MNKLRTIIRLYCQQTDQKKISKLCETSRNTIKKYIGIWNSLNIGYEDFTAKSDAKLYGLFCIIDSLSKPNPHMNALEAFMPSASKDMCNNSMTRQR